MFSTVPGAGGDQSLAVGSVNQDVKGKKQPDACLTKCLDYFSFKSVSSMDRSNVGGRFSLSAAAKGRRTGRLPSAGKCGWVRQRPGDPTKFPSPFISKAPQRERAVDAHASMGSLQGFDISHDFFV